MSARKSHACKWSYDAGWNGNINEVLGAACGRNSREDPNITFAAEPWEADCLVCVDSARATERKRMLDAQDRFDRLNTRYHELVEAS